MKYILILTRDTVDRGRTVHYKKRGGNPRKLEPWCRTAGWADMKWERDPVDGLGADICGKCVNLEKQRVRRVKDKENVRRRKAYLVKRDQEIAYQLKYRTENRDYVIKQQRRRYAQRDPETVAIETKKRRARYEANREAILQQQREYYEAHKEEINEKRRSMKNGIVAV